MKTNKFLGFFAVIVILGLVLSAFTPLPSILASAVDRRSSPTGNGGYGTGGQVGSTTSSAARGRLTPLSAQEQSALQKAILEEYGAFNLYTAVIAQLGSTAPFTQIVKAEQQHVNVLVGQADKYGVAVPVNPGLTPTPEFVSLAGACQAGVKAEIADAALYDNLKLATTHTDLLQVFNNLQRASLNSHLPAFQACD